MVIRWLMLVALAFLALSREGFAKEATTTIYSEDPKHLWNQLYAAMFVRTTTDGTTYDDLLDPPFWARTQYLLTGKSNSRAIELLDRFAKDQAALSEMNSWQKALMQRDLIGVFSWLTGRRPVFNKPGEEETRLARALSQAIRHSALDAAEISKLPAFDKGAGRNVPSEFDPKNPERAFFPKDLLVEDSPWIVLGAADHDSLAATLHFRAFAGRSAFEVRMRHPEGRAAGEAYLKEINLPETRVSSRFDSTKERWVSPAAVQFPANTIWALVRRAVLLDQRGRPVASPMIESIQLRVYREIAGYRSWEPALPQPQVFFEWELRRQGQPGGGTFHFTETGEGQYPHFMGKGFDPFELPDGRLRSRNPQPVLSCYTCHSGVGIHSVLSRSRALEEPGASPVEFTVTSSARTAEVTETWARQQPLWMLLRWVDGGW